MSRRVKVIRFCLNPKCGKLLAGKGRREYCEDNPECQQVKADALKRYMQAYAKLNKPWLRKNKESVRSYRKRTKALMIACPYCGELTVNHFACDTCRDKRFGLDGMYGVTM